ncbi:DUF885 family protein [Sphingomonas hengshuiensis]|nr:DUF885 family protein [Sphingomonas hengshuiensis]
MTAMMMPGEAGAQAAASSAAATATPASHAAFLRLFQEWRQYLVPPMKDYLPDYSAATMQRKAAELPSFRARLNAIDRSGWTVEADNDFRLVEAEMNGADFNFRVLTPWRRDPTFYANVFADWSDVPLHEGPYAEPHIDLYKFKYPLNAADQAKLTAMLAAVPAMLQAARVNLKPSNAKDLWTYGDRAFKEQSATLQALEAGTLVLRTLDGPTPAPITGAKPALLKAIRDARAATDSFAAWVKAEAPGKTGPAGVGKENYDWFVKNVELLPYSWDEQEVLLRRELERSIAALREEEVRNRALPPIQPIEDPVAYRKMAEAKAEKFARFIVETGLIPDRAYVRPAVDGQTGNYVPPEKRNFFSHITALDPLPLVSHAIHWVDLARARAEPPASPVRSAPALFSIYANRSEGYATAFEEIAMRAGLYDDIPHGRELVWIALANRAARGLASLYVQSGQMDLAQAGRFHAEWTPRGWSDPESPLVGFEQLLYARQPGYGPSYVTGKLQLDRLLANASHAAEQAGKPFVMSDVLARTYAAGILPWPLIEREVNGTPAK